uniref:RNA polymerase I associated factor, A49-like protein n=1 Tax=Steinernema glaseri TaxID=37863 RepID=A0A1I7ZHA3_9BILA
MSGNETEKRIHGLLDFEAIDDDVDVSFADRSLNTTTAGNTTMGSVFGAVNLDVSRKSILSGGKDVVGILGHGKFVDPMAVRFIETRSGRKRTYSIKTKVCPQIVHLGTEEPNDGAFDYVMAVVNKRTRAVEYRNVKVMRFEARHTDDPDSLLIGSTETPKINYDLDNSMAKEEFWNKRRMLTAQFGSSKSIKIQEQAQNRKIDDNTLGAVNATTLGAVNTEESNVSLLESDMKKDLNLSLLNTESISQTLPPAVEDAAIPSMVYPTSLFVSKFDVETYSEEALKYLDQKLAELVLHGMPKCVLRFKSSATNPERAVLIVMLATMIRFCQGIGRFKPLIAFNEVLTSGIPENIVNFVRAKFFKGEIRRDKRDKKRMVIDVDEQEKERMVAWTLCLAIVVDSALSVPLTPFATDMKLTEARMVKVLTALGCTITQASHNEAMNLNTTRMARLEGPPSRIVKKFVKGGRGKR